MICPSTQTFPTRLRAYGVGLGSASQWLFNFVVTEFTPHAIKNIGWRTFLLFGILCLAMSIFTLVFMKETKGRTLEEIDLLFGAVDEEQRRADVEHAMHKGLVAHSDTKEGGSVAHNE